MFLLSLNLSFFICKCRNYLKVKTCHNLHGKTLIFECPKDTNQLYPMLLGALSAFDGKVNATFNSQFYQSSGRARLPSFFLTLTKQSFKESLCAYLLICTRLFATLWTIVHQASLSMGFSRQEYWSGLPATPSQGDLSDPGIKPASQVSRIDR